MAANDMQGLIDRLDDLLESERSSLLSGNLEKIGPILEDKQKLIDRFNALDLERGPELESVHRKLMRNQELLDGALEGIRKVAARMAAMRQVRQALETYDQRGKRQTIDGAVVRKIEKRA
ncbi:flagellar export chaperone FlgN [Roseovarius sp.]|jgi:flagellar biosynthesis/type III secretory pathway chaperone